jgi:hypothetical protein
MQNAMKRELRVRVFEASSAALLPSDQVGRFPGKHDVGFPNEVFSVLDSLPLPSIMIHLVYRWKTHGWTRPWGGWSDLEAAQ